jgi:exopolysaccharide production protein ExoZ
MACAVMAYHYSSWTWGEFDSSTILGRLGLYGVSFFYILSGLTLYIVYKDYTISTISLFHFGAKRFFRIYPLLWIVTILSALALRITDWGLIFLNLSGLFGFIKPEAYIGTGVWSIGNELFFYAFFPVLLFLEKRYLFFFYLLVLITYLSGLYFAFFLIDPSVQLRDQWWLYVNPLNQLFLFSGGVLIGHIVIRYEVFIRRYLPKYFIGGLVIIFCFYPVTGDVVAIVTGSERIIFSLVCLLACFLVFVSDIQLNKIAHSFFSFLGETSYSIYLLHPLVFKLVKGICIMILHFGDSLIMPFSIVGTLIASFLTYNYLEKPMIFHGKKIAARFMELTKRP